MSILFPPPSENFRIVPQNEGVQKNAMHNITKYFEPSVNFLLDEYYENKRKRRQTLVFLKHLW